MVGDTSSNNQWYSKSKMIIIISDSTKLVTSDTKLKTAGTKPTTDDTMLTIPGTMPDTNSAKQKIYGSRL